MPPRHRRKDQRLTGEQNVENTFEHKPSQKSSCLIIGDDGKSKSVNRYRRLAFALGIILGILLACIFARSKDLLTLEVLSELQLDTFSEVFWDIKSALPLTILEDAKAILKEQQAVLKSNSFAVGRKLKRAGFETHFPVVLVPGVISSGLESWSTENCSAPYFRKRLWGSWTMLKAMLLDKVIIQLARTNRRAVGWWVKKYRYLFEGPYTIRCGYGA